MELPQVYKDLFQITQVQFEYSELESKTKYWLGSYEEFACPINDESHHDQS